MDNINIAKDVRPGCVLLTVTGAVSSYTYGEFESRVHGALKENHVVLDLSGVTAMSSSGLGVLISAYDEGLKYQRRLCILNPSESVRRAIELTGFSEMFTVIKSLDELD
ncbi:STAS domain-containing protein [Treponema pallidum]|uniref:Anti-sigma factor antagonist n=4 Tax=Treponema pallidum TaxID=160 RepID=O83249_TREPA|nr:STAS domain-containing protein [Treponema pallidum]AAC65207.1 anti-sigma F factor antagonist (spoIIAA-1) [Treponema pallidum subsp. pallidum str. Nichols]ACD70646.1 anti-sigma F factor antagonist [Treponema pallidum subsp. pallidum SS14]AEZ57343.1 anti sigma factor antagonist [Treponema pallidum subsp. pertenue str. SamoaD]AEZ58412.1 anti sigma factor antagonist [Treponema pallidum subsp. pertenue str. CDC2]AEZ59480.1 anti sigma factor antagonist [Treponema pallidum subsp. pertenue str. Gau